mmetsp:Transcript_47095/g.125135  ORF Transcript_47095/g.125135 Transcript_47095/m.125135 type:complete len:115 (+) Transcript_47095:598-942(+)
MQVDQTTFDLAPTVSEDQIWRIGKLLVLAFMAVIGRWMALPLVFQGAQLVLAILGPRGWVLHLTARVVPCSAPLKPWTGISAAVKGGMLVWPTGIQAWRVLGAPLKVHGEVWGQ